MPDLGTLPFVFGISPVFYPALRLPEFSSESQFLTHSTKDNVLIVMLYILKNLALSRLLADFRGRPENLPLPR
jgi:hypothetical protein